MLTKNLEHPERGSVDNPFLTYMVMLFLLVAPYLITGMIYGPLVTSIIFAVVAAVLFTGVVIFVEVSEDRRYEREAKRKRVLEKEYGIPKVLGSIKSDVRSFVMDREDEGSPASSRDVLNFVKSWSGNVLSKNHQSFDRVDEPFKGISEKDQIAILQEIGLFTWGRFGLVGDNWHSIGNNRRVKPQYRTYQKNLRQSKQDLLLGVSG